MSDNTIFQNIKPQSQPPQVQTQPIVAAPVVSPLFPPSVKKEPPPSSGFPFATLFKVGIGMLLTGIVIFLIIHFAIPYFTKNKNETVTLSYWGLWEGENTMRVVIADFEKQNPNIKVTYAKQDIKEYKNRLSTRIQNGNGPDIFLFHNTWLPQVFVFLLPLPTDVIQKNDFEKLFYPVTKSDLIKNGAIYGLPTEIDTLALFTNSEIFRQAGSTVPTNWEDFGKTARLLTVKDENGNIKTSGAAMGTFDNITHAPDLISLLLVQNGADLKNLSGTSRSVVDALDFYTSFAKDERKVWDQTLDPSLLAFAKGNLAMYFGYSWDVFAIKAINPNLAFKIAPVPHLQGRSMTIASYWNNGVSVKSTHQKESLLFIKFLSQKETMQKLFSESSKTRLFGEPYPRTDLTESLKSNELVYPFVSQAHDATSSFFAGDTFDNGLNAQMNGYLGNAVRSILGNTSIDTAVETLIKGVDQIVKQYGG